MSAYTVFLYSLLAMLGIAVGIAVYAWGWQAGYKDGREEGFLLALPVLRSAVATAPTGHAIPGPPPLEYKRETVPGTEVEPDVVWIGPVWKPPPGTTQHTTYETLPDGWDDPDGTERWLDGPAAEDEEE